MSRAFSRRAQSLIETPDIKGNFITSRAKDFFSNPRNEIGGLSVYVSDIEVTKDNKDWIQRQFIQEMKDVGFRFITYKNNLSIVLQISKDIFNSRWRSLIFEFNNAYTSFDEAPGISFLFNRYALFNEDIEYPIPEHETETELLDYRLQNGNLQIGTNTIFIDNIWGCKFKGEMDASNPSTPEDTVLNQLRRQFPYYATL